MHYLLQENLFEEKGYDDLIQVLNNANIPYSVHKMQHFTKVITPEFPKNSNHDFIALGSYAFVKSCSNKLGAYVESVILKKNSMIKAWMVLNEELLNYDASIVPFFQLTNLKTSPNGEDKLWFFKPFEDNKVVDGGLKTINEIHEWVKEVQHKEGYNDSQFNSWLMNYDDLFIVAKPKEVYSEYRFWIVKNKIATMSQYKRKGLLYSSPVVDDDIIQYVNDLLKKELFKNVYYVMDVCRCEDGLKVVEVQTLNAAGFYSANMGKLVAALEEYYEEKG